MPRQRRACERSVAFGRQTGSGYEFRVVLSKRILKNSNGHRSRRDRGLIKTRKLYHAACMRVKSATTPAGRPPLRPVGEVVGRDVV
ncbi:hypothetical protein EVAR_28328_1 [Eumeta japonica]|uniref:Uncharacterized protein n=1 Tax=Eumeta variegata TaxID=151549 RepID=A0A4C1V8V8_EUMVA|nr:hypothetical protein EVAR_28328_1 [Eumeta japonica]